MIYTDLLLYTVYILYYHYDCYIFYYIIIIMMCDPINILSLSLSLNNCYISPCWIESTMVLHELVALLINLIHLLSNINLGSTISAIYGNIIQCVLHGMRQTLRIVIIIDDVKRFTNDCFSIR